MQRDGVRNMCPLYDHFCDSCEKGLVFFRPVEECGKSENCTDCGKKTKRIYSFNVQKEFTPFFDEQYGTVISSRRQEERLMRKHGHVYTKDTPQAKKFKQEIKHKSKKPIITSG